METKRKILNRHRKGEGSRRISRELNIARNTVKSVIRSHKDKDEVMVPVYIRNNQTYPALGEYIQNLEKLLRDNKNARPRRTIKQLFEELCFQGFKGSYSAVNRYATRWKKLTDIVSPSACIPLSFAPAEAYQFDWSTDEGNRPVNPL